MTSSKGWVCKAYYCKLQLMVYLQNVELGLFSSNSWRCWRLRIEQFDIQNYGPSPSSENNISFPLISFNQTSVLLVCYLYWFRHTVFLWVFRDFKSHQPGQPMRRLKEPRTKNIWKNNLAHTAMRKETSFHMQQEHNWYHALKHSMSSTLKDYHC